MKTKGNGFEVTRYSLQAEAFRSSTEDCIVIKKTKVSLPEHFRTTDRVHDCHRSGSPRTTDACTDRRMTLAHVRNPIGIVKYKRVWDQLHDGVKQTQKES